MNVAEVAAAEEQSLHPTRRSRAYVTAVPKARALLSLATVRRATIQASTLDHTGPFHNLDRRARLSSSALALGCESRVSAPVRLRDPPYLLYDHASTPLVLDFFLLFWLLAPGTVDLHPLLYHRKSLTHLAPLRRVLSLAHRRYIFTLEIFARPPSSPSLLLATVPSNLGATWSPAPPTIMSTSSGPPESWIASFCSLLGHEYFAEVSEEFIEDDFNLTGLQSQVNMYKEALEVRGPYHRPRSNEAHQILTVAFCR